MLALIKFSRFHLHHLTEGVYNGSFQLAHQESRSRSHPLRFLDIGPRFTISPQPVSRLPPYNGDISGFVLLPPFEDTQVHNIHMAVWWQKKAEVRGNVLEGTFYKTHHVCWVSLSVKHYLIQTFYIHVDRCHHSFFCKTPPQMSKSPKTLCQQLYLTVMRSPPTLINSPAVLTLGKWNVRFVAVILMGRCCAKS